MNKFCWLFKRNSWWRKHVNLEQSKRQHGNETSKLHYMRKIMNHPVCGENGNRTAQREFGVSESNVRLWRKSKENLEKMPQLKRANRGKKAAWPELETDLLPWITEKRFYHPSCDWKHSNFPKMWNTTFLKAISRPGTIGANASWRETICHFDRKQLWHNVFQMITRRRSWDFIASSSIAVKKRATHFTSSLTWMKLHSRSTCHQTERSTTRARKLSKSIPQEMRRIESPSCWPAEMAQN